MAEFNIGDRFYCGNSGYFTLTESTPIGWKVYWNLHDSLTGIVYTYELEKLELFGSKLTKINSEKHLLELNLKYG